MLVSGVENFQTIINSRKMSGSEPHPLTQSRVPGSVCRFGMQIFYGTDCAQAKLPLGKHDPECRSTLTFTTLQSIMDGFPDEG